MAQDILDSVVEGPEGDAIYDLYEVEGGSGLGQEEDDGDPGVDEEVWEAVGAIGDEDMDE